MKATLPVLLILCIALGLALSACGDNNTLVTATPTANAAEVASVTPVTQPNVGMGATAESNMLTAVVNPTPIMDMTPSAGASATPSPTPTPTR
ncbi:MAG TPA: hypothetical protein VF826_10020 [Chloroflexia bacterium]|jgi:uncharacterized protein (UPF0264 family)